MADREVMELNGQDVVDQTGETVETITGAGRVWIITASYEERRQRMLVAGPEAGAVFSVVHRICWSPEEKLHRCGVNRRG